MPKRTAAFKVNWAGEFRDAWRRGSRRGVVRPDETHGKELDGIKARGLKAGKLIFHCQRKVCYEIRRRSWLFPMMTTTNNAESVRASRPRETH
jgi:hypothetical protein